MAENEKKENGNSVDKCPHCGVELSPWQKVLLSVDRAVICQNCWYRIILDPFDKKKVQPPKSDEDKGEE
jgi:DNA-directed RNA polymerase subunit RPC12/RpoP